MSGQRASAPHTSDALALVRRAQAAFNERGAWAIEELVADDVEWGTTGSFPGIDRMYRGPAGMTKWREDMKSVWASFEVRVGEILDQRDDRVVIEERIRGVGQNSGVEVQMSVFSVYYLRDGKVSRRVPFKHRREAVEAVGAGPAGR